MNDVVAEPGSASMDADSAQAVDLARRLADSVQHLVQQLHDLEAEHETMQQRLAHANEQAQAAEAQRRAVAASLSGSVGHEELQSLEQVLQRLSQDPNHIMVLAAVAQQAGTLLRVVETYGKVKDALQ